jgi:hypothetical protein
MMEGGKWKWCAYGVKLLLAIFFLEMLSVFVLLSVLSSGGGDDWTACLSQEIRRKRIPAAPPFLAQQRLWTSQGCCTRFFERGSERDRVVSQRSRRNSLETESDMRGFGKIVCS